MEGSSSVKYDRRTQEMTMKDISTKDEEKVIALRKEKMFKCIMTKRSLKVAMTLAGNTFSENDKTLEASKRAKALQLSFPWLSRLSSAKELLQSMKQSFYSNDDSQFNDILEEMNSAMTKGEMTELLSDKEVVGFLIPIFTRCDSLDLFYLLSSIFVLYTFASSYVTEQLNSVKVLDNLIFKVFDTYQNKQILTNLLTIIWNIHNDFGNSVISQTQLSYYLSLFIIGEEQSEQKIDGLLNETILLNIYLLVDNSLTLLQPQINQFIPFLLKEINIAAEDRENTEILHYVLMILYSLTSDDNICQLMLEQGVMNYLCDLFKYLLLTDVEIEEQKLLVLIPKSVICVIKLFSNFFAMPDIVVAAMLPEDLFFPILTQLIRLHSMDSMSVTEENESYLANQTELMALVANISACSLALLMNYIGQNEELIQSILTVYTNNHRAVKHIIHIIENCFLRSNIKAIILLHRYNFMILIYNVLVKDSFHSDVKIDAIRVLILIIQNVFESKGEDPFNVLLEIGQRDMVHVIQSLHTQSNDEKLTESCFNFITLLNKLTSLI